MSEHYWADTELGEERTVSVEAQVGSVMEGRRQSDSSEGRVVVSEVGSKLQAQVAKGRLANAAKAGISLQWLQGFECHGDAVWRRQCIRRASCANSS